MGSRNTRPYLGIFRRMKLDKSTWGFHKIGEEIESDKIELAKMESAGKMELITYLRECFYGPEASSGRVQRVFEFSKSE
jgi:hypothetical protein